jgi:hypothetical protein
LVGKNVGRKIGKDLILLLQNAIPESMVKSKALQRVDLKGNPLTTLLESITKLKALQGVDLATQ